MQCHSTLSCFFFFFNDTATTEIYPLSLPDALPIFAARVATRVATRVVGCARPMRITAEPLTVLAFKTFGAVLEGEDGQRLRSEEHTSELQSLSHVRCRLLLVRSNLTRSRVDDNVTK